MTPIRAYVTRRFGEPEHSHGNYLLAALYQDWTGRILTVGEDDPIRRRWIDDAPGVITLAATPESAHVSMLPLPWSSLDRDGRRVWSEEVAWARSRRLPVVGLQGMSERRPPRTDSPDLLLQHSSFEDEIGPCATVPGWKLDIADFAERDGLDSAVRAAGVPVVTFRGNMLTRRPPLIAAPTTLWPRHRIAGRRRVNWWVGASVRWRALSAVRDAASKGELHARLQPQHLSGPNRVSARQAQSPAEYASSIIEADYVLCTRGTENFSYRLWEALSAGRTPLLVDSGERLPAIDGHPLTHGIVAVAPEDLERLGIIVADHFRSVIAPDPVGHAARQRALFERYLPAPFFRSALQGLLASSRSGERGN